MWTKFTTWRKSRPGFGISPHVQHYTVLDDTSTSFNGSFDTIISNKCAVDRHSHGEAGMNLDQQDQTWWMDPSREPTTHSIPVSSRQNALELLSHKDIGSFVLRCSSSRSGCYALSVKVPTFNNPTGISHYLITKTSSGMFKIYGMENKEWSSLEALVTHHTVMREMLPCPLVRS